MTGKNIFSVFILIVSALSVGYSQNCTCKDNFDWIKKTFEENDAGFQYSINKKGKQAYDYHNRLYMAKIDSVRSLEECTNVLYDWLTFFRSGHIGIELLGNPGNIATSTENQEGKCESVKVDILQFKKYIANKKEVDYEGIWETPPYKIGIRKDAGGYVGFIISSEVTAWKEGDVKLRITKNKEKEQSVFYLRDRSPEECGAPGLLGNNYLQIGRFTLKRLSPSFPADKAIEDYFKLMSAESPYLEELNNTTLYLRIPSFAMEAKESIDSVP